MWTDKTNKELLDLLNNSIDNVVKVSQYEILKSKLDTNDCLKLDKFFNILIEEISGLDNIDKDLFINDFKNALPTVYLKSNSLAQALERLDYRRFHNYYKENNIEVLEDDNHFLINNISILTIKLSFKPILSILQYALNIVNTKLTLFGLSLDNESRIIAKSSRFKINLSQVELHNHISVLILEDDTLTLKFNNSLTDHYAAIMFMHTLLANYFKLLGKFHDRTNDYIIQITDKKLSLDSPRNIKPFITQNSSFKYSEDIEPDYTKYNPVFSYNGRDEKNEDFIQRNMIEYSQDTIDDESLIINEIDIYSPAILKQAIKEYRLDIPNTSVDIVNVIKYKDREFITSRIKK